MENSSINVPVRIQKLNKDSRQYPIPFTTLVDPKGEPHFTTTDINKWWMAIKNRLCAICGEQLDDTLAFIGGEKCMEHHHFFDAAMHLECAEFAVNICPFLNNKNYSKLVTKSQDIDGVKFNIDENIASTRPSRMGILLCTGYEVVSYENNFYVHALDVKEVRWF